MTVYVGQGLQSEQATAESQADRQKQVLARQIAQAVFDRGISELRRDYRSEDREMEIDPFSGRTVEHKGVSFRLQESAPDGSERLPAIGVLKSGSLPDGLMWVLAKGHYEDATYRIKGEIVRDVNGFSAVGVKGGLSFVKGAGSSFMISGMDTNPVDQHNENDLKHGSGKGYDRPGIQLNNDGTAGQVEAEFEEDQVVGVNGEGDIVQEDPLKVDPNKVAQEIRDNTTHSESEIRSGGSIGSKEDPAVAVVDGDLKLSGNFHGVGALVVDGEFEMRGNAQWEGIVIVTDEGRSEEGESEDDEEDDEEEEEEEDDSDEDEDRNCNEDDKNKGHGNDCDRYDEDNPGNSSGPPDKGDGQSEGEDEDEEEEDEEDEDEDEEDEENDDGENDSDGKSGPEVDIGGNANVYGSLMMETGGNGSLAVRGDSRLQYSSSALAVLAGVLPTMEESATIRVTNRRSNMLN